MNPNSNIFRTNNEQVMLINILNTMYNNNIRQIDSITNTLNDLVESNNQIRDLLVQLLNNNNNPRRTRRSDFNSNRYQSLTDRLVGFRQPSYMIGEFTIPRTYSNSNNNNTNNLFNNLLQNFFEPVEVYPSQTQIETATRRVRYCDITRPINTQCPISMEDFNDNDVVTVIRPCGHIFHSQNIMNWFRTNSRCPVCRYDIRDYNSGTSSEFFNNTPVVNDSSNNNVERNASPNPSPNPSPNTNTNTNTRNISPNQPYDLVTINTMFDLFNTNDFMDQSGNYNFSQDRDGSLLTNILSEFLNRSRNDRR
jgi:hypothetical protein